MMSKEIDYNVLRENNIFLEDQELYMATAEIDNNESITPTTNKGHVDFNLLHKKLMEVETSKEEGDLNDTSIFVKNILKFSQDDSVFIKKYQYEDDSTSKVLRFGINHNNSALKEFVINKYNQTIQNTIKISDTISDLSKKSKHDQFLEKIKSYTEQSKDQITSIEKNIVTQAINYLDNTENKTVLVDLFVRDKGTGKIKFTKKNDIETHSVVLYKQDYNYLIIDPNNAEFSSVLIGAHDNIKICISKDFKIYVPKNSTGYELDSWRDCIDIAVKLAFNLNKCSQHIVLKEIKEFQFIDDNSLRKNIAIEVITNQQDISGQFPSILEEQNARAKQASSIKESHLTSLFIKLLHQKNSILEEKLENSIYTHQKKNYINKEYLNTYISKKMVSHEAYISFLKDGVGIIENSINEIDGFNTEAEMKLIGEL